MLNINLPNKKEIVFLVSGFAAGVGSCAVFQKLNKPVGKLFIDDTDPKKTLYNFEIDNLDVLDKKKSLTLNIERVNTQQ